MEGADAGRKPTNVPELKLKWVKIPPCCCMGLINSNRLVDVIALSHHLVKACFHILLPHTNKGCTICIDK